MWSALLLHSVLVSAPCATEACIDESLSACWKDRSKCKIELTPGVIRISKTVEICPGVTIEGAGSSESTADPTFLRVSKPIDVIHVLHRLRCRELKRPWVGRARIRGLYLQDLDHSTETSTISGVTHGILAESAPDIEDVSVVGFVIGIRITGASNSWRMSDVSVQTAEHAGFLVHGHDTNVGQWYGGTAADNCFSATRWGPEVAKLINEKPNAMQSFEECAGLVDHSFLGSTYVAVHTASNYEHKPGCYANSKTCTIKAYSGIRLDSTSQRSLCLGCYTEGGQLDSYVGPQSMALGGLSMWGGPGLRVSGQIVNGLRLRNGDLSVDLGEAQGAATSWITFRNMRTGWGFPLRLVIDEQRGQAVLQPANTNALSSMRIQLTKTGSVPLGTIVLGGQPVPIR